MRAHRGRHLVLLALLPAVVIGCGSGGSRSSTGWANKAELSWMRSYGHWSRGVGGALANFEATSTPVFRSFGQKGMPGLRRAAAALEARCARVPLATPPTARLQPALDGARSGCRLYVSVARAVRTTRTAVVYGVMSNALVDQLRRGDHRFQTGSLRALLGVDLLTTKAASATSRQSHIDPVLGREASRLAGHAVRVRCWSNADWQRVNIESSAISGRTVSSSVAGMTPVSGSLIDVQGDVCAELEALREHPNSSASKSAVTADAVRVLAHETQHAQGVANEAVAECYALQKVSDVARDLGASATTAADLAREEWSDYPEEPAGYHTASCHNGGLLDLRPSDAVWP